LFFIYDVVSGGELTLLQYGYDNTLANVTLPPGDITVKIASCNDRNVCSYQEILCVVGLGSVSPETLGYLDNYVKAGDVQKLLQTMTSLPVTLNISEALVKIRL